MSESGGNPAGGPPAESLEDLYENAPCGYLSLQPDGRIFKVNATFATWIGISQEQLLGKRLHDLLNVAGRIFYETHFAPLLRMQGHFDEVALDFVTQSGGRLPTLVNAAERRDAEGVHLFTRLTVFNATDRRRYERELVEAREAAEAARKQLQELHAKAQASLLDERATAALREQFIAVLGHDLRNPLAAIAGGIELLMLRMPMNEKAVSIATTIQRSVARMNGMIDNVLDFARGRLGGGISLHRSDDEPVELVLQQVIAELHASVPNRTIESRFALTAPVNCDGHRIGQLASNLLGNALTHGASDKPVRLSATTADGCFELVVANSGDPIPPDMLKTIFQPFARADFRPNQQGLGLGLYIAHEIAVAHGGTLEVRSTEAETRFTFRMPLAM